MLVSLPSLRLDILLLEEGKGEELAGLEVGVGSVGLSMQESSLSGRPLALSLPHLPKENMRP